MSQGRRVARRRNRRCGPTATATSGSGYAVTVVMGDCALMQPSPQPAAGSSVAHRARPTTRACGRVVVIFLTTQPSSSSTFSPSRITPTLSMPDTARHVKPIERPCGHRGRGGRSSWSRSALRRSGYTPLVLRSMPDVLRVQRPRLVHVVRPLDDRSAVGEHRELVLVHVELQQEALKLTLPIVSRCRAISSKFSRRRHAVRHLHGVAAAQARRLRAVFAVEPLELPPLAARAIDLAQQRGDLDAAMDVLPDVEVDQLAVDRRRVARSGS